MQTLNNQLSNSFVEMEYGDSGVEPIPGYEELYNTAYRDYQTLNVNAVLQFVKNYPQSVLKVNVPPEVKIETLSQKLYSDKDYWDLILVLNNKEFLYDMPKSNDIISIEVDDLVKNYFYNSEKPYQGNIPEGLTEAYSNALMETKTQENNDNQTFIVLNPNYKKQFLRAVKYGL